MKELKNIDGGNLEDGKLGKDVNKFVKSLGFENENELEARPRGKFIFPPTSKWYLSLPALAHTSSLPSPTSAFLTAKHQHASTLLAHDTSLYSPSTSTSDSRFLTRVLASGTLSDRLSALTLLVQASPVHNIRALESLAALSAKKGREHSLKALRCLVDWWIAGGAPDRKLKYFRDQPVTHPDVTDSHWILWYFEDWLKKFFWRLLHLFEGLLVDPLPYVRTQAIHLVFQLLRDKPEQEQNLLRLLVHKLGDAEKPVASKASYFLLQLLQSHPHMKSIVVHDVSGLILTPTATTPTPTPSASPGNTHARYYAVVTFNQIVLLPGDKDVAARLVDVYFALFREILGEQAGQGKQGPEEQHEQRDFTPKQRGRKQIKNTATKKDKGKAKEAGLGFQEVPDTDAKLVSQILTGINRALPFAKTENSSTFDAHINTLFRITHTATFNVSVQTLMLLQRVAVLRPSVTDRFYRTLYASLVDPRLATSSKQAMYLNLLFRAVKVDRSHERVAAFVRRIVQALGMHQPAFICGGLFLLGELFETAQEAREMMTRRREDEDGIAEGYDARKRDPQFAHAIASSLWELLPLQQHYHPSVALHARQLLAHTRVTATADLGLNTLAHFLDRFVYRNARKPRARGASAMQPGLEDEAGGVRAGRAAGEGERAVNQEGFWRREEGDVPVDQVFFHRFFAKKHEKDLGRREKAERRKGKREGKGVAEGEGADVDVDADVGDAERDGEGSESDPEEAEIWKAMKASVPELGDSDVDGDDSAQSVISEGDDDGDDDGPAADDGDDASVDADGSELDFVEDPDDLLSDGSAADPPGLLEYGEESDAGDNSAGDEGEWHGFQPGARQKRARTDVDGDSDAGKRKKKKRRQLPLFASYEEYAGIIEREPEDNL